MTTDQIAAEAAKEIDARVHHIGASEQSDDTKRLDWALRYLKELFPDQITKASSFTINLKSNIIDREYIDAAMSQTK